MSITLATVVDALAESIDSDALSHDQWLVATATLAAAAAQGLEVKAVHAELVKRGYDVKLTACYGRAFAGRILALGAGTDGKSDLPAAYDSARGGSERKLVTLCVAAYNVKGGAAALARIIGKRDQTRAGAVEDIVKFKTAPKSGPVTTTPGTFLTDDAPTTPEEMLKAMANIMSGLSKVSGTSADRAAAAALAARLAVWGGIPAQRVTATV